MARPNAPHLSFVPCLATPRSPLHYPEAAEPVRATAQAHGLEPSSLRFVPVVSRKANAVALLDGPQGRVLGFVAVDGFI